MKKIAVAASLLLGLGGLQLGLDADRQVVIALCLLWVIAVLWLTETFHITITALMIPLAAVATGLLDVPAALKSFAHPIVFMFLGGFCLAGAMQAQGLDRWLADSVLRAAGGRLLRAMVLLAAATALLSMWVNNTAITAVMLPLVLGLLREKPNLPASACTFVLLAVAYSASIGGMGTVIGSAPNGIVASQLDMSFMDWLVIGLPAALLLWPLMLLTLRLVLRPNFLDNRVEVTDTAFEWTAQRKRLVAIFLVTAAGWVCSQPLGDWLGVKEGMDSMVAILAIVLIGASGVASWQQLERSADWGVILLFGGGLTLSEILKTSGASLFLGNGLAEWMAGWGPLQILLALVAFVVFLTEFTSNTATTALLVPVFVAVPASIMEPAVSAVAVGICASCAFMLPVATPPNAIVHATGELQPGAMKKVGLVLNLAAIVTLTALFMVYRATL